MTNFMHAAALELSAALISDTREDGTSFVRRADDSAEWIADAIRAAHGGMMPDDTKYSMVSEVADAIAEALNYDEDLDDARAERVDGLVPVYNSERVTWLASHLARADYVDEARREFGSEGADYVDQLGAGIYAEYDEIWGVLVYAIAERAEELEAEADETADAE